MAGVGPRRGRLDDSDDDALAPHEGLPPVDLAPNRVDLARPGVALLEDPRATVHGDPDDVPPMCTALQAGFTRRCRSWAARAPVDTVKLPLTKAPSSGATRFAALVDRREGNVLRTLEATDDLTRTQPALGRYDRRKVRVCARQRSVKHLLEPEKIVVRRTSSGF